MTVIPFPVLTIDAITSRDWEPVLVLPLPQRPSLELLDRARGQLMLYLDWIVTEMVLIDDAWVVRREIVRTTDRLLEIAAILPDAMEAYAARPLTSIPPKHMASVMNWLAQRDDDGALMRQMLSEAEPEIK